MSYVMSENKPNEYWMEQLKEKREKINSISPSFCSAKWLQTTLYLQNGYNHSCHHPSPHKIPVKEVLENPAALHNSNYKKQQRIKMLNGERPKECDYCWKIEDQGKDHYSDRHYKTADWWSWDKVDLIATSNPTEDVYPSYLEVSFSNACNFACAYCSPEISSTWMKDIEENGDYPVKFGSGNLDYLRSVEKFPYKHSDDNPYVDAFWKWFPEALPHLKVFRVTGGEPTMSKDVWKVLDYIYENAQPELSIAINSNLGTDPRLIQRLIDACNKLEGKVKQIEIYTSCEAIGEQAEYIRDGLDYNYWMANCERVLSETNANVAIMTTLNILSMTTFNDFIEDIMKLRITYNKDLANNRIPLSVNYLRFPPHLQCTLLDIDTRISYANQYELTAKSWLKYDSPDKFARIYLEEYDQIQRFCEYLRGEDNTAKKYRADFVNYIKAYDIRRSKNFSETFPEYTHLLEEWNVQKIHSC
jgi:pyruvate-formate lyase-activating enzyme|tara:strand:+ start:3041 stop:4459 length:1419 start_codon:yes stop_codon:yes gene_type:complete